MAKSRVPREGSNYSKVIVCSSHRSIFLWRIVYVIPNLHEYFVGEDDPVVKKLVLSQRFFHSIFVL